ILTQTSRSSVHPIFQEALAMVAWLAPRSLVLRRNLRLGCRALCAITGLLFATAAPGWAFTPVALAEIGPQIPFAVGSIPTGGYLLVWQDVRRSDFAVQAQRFTAAGQPQGPVKTLDVGPHSQLSPFSVAVR